MARIQVLLHFTDRHYFRTGYFLPELCNVWREQGHELAVTRGPIIDRQADLVIPHLDLSLWPHPYDKVVAEQDHVLNLKLGSIRKSDISSNLLDRNSDWDGLVIVKTELNFGGFPETRLARPGVSAYSLVQRLAGRLAHMGSKQPGLSLIWRCLGLLESGSYTVFQKLDEVPEEVFENPSLVVEKFLPERVGEDYALRVCYLLGDRHLTVRAISSGEIVKGGSAHTVEVIDTDPRILARCREAGLNYGKIDYLLNDGEPVVIDLNWTPATNVLRKGGVLFKVVDRLAPGLDSLLT